MTFQIDLLSVIPMTLVKDSFKTVCDLIGEGFGVCFLLSDTTWWVRCSWTSCQKNLDSGLTFPTGQALISECQFLPLCVCECMCKKSCLLLLSYKLSVRIRQFRAVKKKEDNVIIN